ncbi:MAG: NADH:flavin oxidoreductase/NADH oxidase family protein [Pseudomonadota bacterium]
MTDTGLFSPLELPNRQVISNRLCKAAMEENLSDEGQIPGQHLFNLYRQWAAGGVGLILTGNVMVAPDALTGPGGVVLEDDSNLEHFKTWAKAGRGLDGAGADGDDSDIQLWMQINHPGRQVYAAMGEQAYSPSDIQLDLGDLSKLFAKPRALSQAEIEKMIERFANTAVLAEQAGFTGVQVHAAHGYLISQFLSPRTNRREDQWGGSLENRSRILREIVKAIRQRVSPEFCVAVKLNSADFQKGGFDQEDAKQVVQQLNELSVDLVELSGGSYESPAMQGGSAQTEEQQNTSTQRREAFFVEFARDIATVAKMPIMVTGGILRRQVAEDALQKDAAGFGVEMLGIARGMAFKPDLPNVWKQGEYEVSLPQIEWKKKMLAALAVMSVTKAQLHRMAAGKKPKNGINPLFALIRDRIRTKLRTKRYRRWREQTASR